MLGVLMMFAIGLFALYLLFFKTYPAIAFQYAGRGERKARAEYQRVRREHPDSPDARKSEAEFIEDFVQRGPKPWKYILLLVTSLLVGIPASCVVGLITTR